ncbi:MAG: ATP-dependent helicase HrpB, partial [Geopsychrobacter sp.]|nr:ATP-dependent helicase HrpB [Geopsychrobacter sp.]
RNWPINIIHSGGEISFDSVDRMTAVIRRALKETNGDILAFLPGAREIERLARQSLSATEDLQICPLHGQLSATLQRQALTKSSRRKLILATNIAETSLTIDGIETVIDSGLCRQPGFDPGSGLTRLQTTRISQASSQQRAGRAGRQGPGTCYRLWSENVQATLLPQTAPEIRKADLTPLALELGAWGIEDANQLDWLDPPPTGALAAAQQLLKQLGLKDQRGRMTKDGERATRLPLHPRFASLLLHAERLKSLSVGCVLAAYLAENGGSTDSKSIDFSTDLRNFAQGLKTKERSFQPRVRAFKQLAAIFSIAPPMDEQLSADLLAELVAKAYPDRVACSVELNGDYLLANGRGASLKDRTDLHNANWLAITDISQNDQNGAQIRRALPLDADWLNRQINIATWQNEVFWDTGSQRIQARRSKKLGAILLHSSHQTASAEQALPILCSLLRKQGEHLLTWSPEVEQFQQRIGLLRRTFGPDWPDLERAELLRAPEDWLSPFLHDIRTAAQLKKFNLLPALQNMLDWRQNQQLNKLSPLRVIVPSGESMKIDYQAEAPVLAVKLQQLFGLAETPSICQGQVPLKLHLLSPAGRPLAITRDLRSFWNQVYPEVKKEMRGRYPKHPWPDDPWLATPTRRLKKFQK